MASLRQYTNQAIIRSLADDDTLTFTDAELNLAEELIDTYCAEYIQPSLKAPFYNVESYLDATFSGNTVTVTSTDTLEANYLKFCNIEIVDSANADEVGTQYAVVSSNNLILTLDSSVSLTGSKKIRLYQLGKFPRVADCDQSDTEFFKRVPPAIRQAASYQAWFIKERPDLFENNHEIDLYNSESIGRGGQHSYTGGSPSQMAFLLNAATVLDRMMSPHAKTLLQKYKIQGLM